MRPLRHVQKMMNSTALSASGIQPPVGSLVRLPATNTQSMATIGTNTAATARRDQFHCVLATNAPRMLVISMVPTTAAP